jgi:cytochrome c556
VSPPLAIASALAALVALLAAACGGAAPRGRPPEPALAEVHSARLRERMADLDRLATAGLEDAARSAASRRDLAFVAGEIADTAARLADAVESLGLEPEDRGHFVAFADALRGSAAELAAAAASAPGPEVQAKVDLLGDACAACHVSYRVLAPE